MIIKGIFLFLITLFILYVYNKEYYERVISLIDGKVDVATKNINDPVSRLNMEVEKFNTKISQTKELIVKIGQDIAVTKNELIYNEKELDRDVRNYNLSLNDYTSENIKDTDFQILKSQKDMLVLKKQSIERKRKLVENWEEKKSNLLKSLPSLKTNVELLKTYVSEIEQRESIKKLTGSSYENVVNIDSNINSIIKEIDNSIIKYDSEETTLNEINIAEKQQQSVIHKDSIKNRLDDLRLKLD